MITDCGKPGMWQLQKIGASSGFTVRC